MYPPGFPGGYIHLLLLQVDGHLVDLAGKLAGLEGVVLHHGRFQVHADAGGLVRGEKRELSGRHLDGTDGFPVDGERHRPARTSIFSTIVSKIHLHGGFALGQLLARCGGGVFEAEVVVGVDRCSVLHIKTPAAEATALRHDDTVGRFVAGLDVGNDLERCGLDVDEVVLEQSGHALVKGEGLTAEHQVGSAGEFGIEQFQAPVVDGQYLVLHRLAEESLLQLLEHLRMLRRKVLGHAEVFRDVVELPGVIDELVLDLAPRLQVDGPGEPAVVIDAPVAEHLEVLDLVTAWGLGVVPGIGHTHALDGTLGGAVDDSRLRHSNSLEDGRHDVDNVVPLIAHLALGLDPLGPVDGHGVTGAAIVGGHLLGPGEGRIEADRPTGRHVRIGGRVTPRIVVFQHEIDVRTLGLVVEVGHFVVEPVHQAFGAGAVVAGDVEDQRVVELAHVLDRLDDPARLVVGHVEVGGEDLGLTGEELLLIGREVLPVLDVSRFVRQLCVGWDDAELFLLLKDPFADHVPALVEAAFLLVDVGLRHVVRGVHRTRGEIDEEGLIRGQRLLKTDPVDGLGGHVVHEVVIGIVRGLHTVLVVVNGGRPLIGLAAQKAVELVEALVVRPAGEGPGGADLPDRSLVPLAEGARAVAIEPQHLPDAGHVVGQHAGGSGEGGGHLGDLGLVGRVVVAAGLERLPGRRTQRRGVELIVHQALAGQLVEVGRFNDTAEGAGAAEAEIVQQDDHHVGRVLGRLDFEHRGRLGVARIQCRDRRVPRALDRQFCPVYLCLLGHARERQAQCDE